ncbi:hypothetical protein [Streptomyces sp. MP131-18]|uniref:hypothetical protein n=1 Tax=Streptomyces sp. MP131-18 TaxID=1857892 RepID=UPI0009D04E2C|nr:hypothetical protein [Streptomyces sp. MP131-18]ONK09497.1 hypothetical protein STBA_01970 [Streptomyces sp. MP131-18]
MRAVLRGCGVCGGDMETCTCGIPRRPLAAALALLTAALLLAGCDTAAHAPTPTPTVQGDGDDLGGMTGGGAR